MRLPQHKRTALGLQASSWRYPSGSKPSQKGSQTTHQFKGD